MHFLWTTGFSVSNYERIEPYAKEALKKYGFESAMLSFIELIKYHCITKETCDKFHGISNDEGENKTREEKRKGQLIWATITKESVGDNIETFIKRIKNGELTKATITEYGEQTEHVHLLCLLDKK